MLKPADELRALIQNGGLDNTLTGLYGSASKESQKKRYLGALDKFCELFGTNRRVCLVSSPGRTEICGNHTDHNNGKVVAAAVDLDIVAIVSPSGNNEINIRSEGHVPNFVSLDNLSRRESEEGTSNALIRGVCAYLAESGVTPGGFDAYTTSNIKTGMGLSSSAAFELLIVSIVDHLYNGGALSHVERAKAAHYAEDKYYGKPSGLMDQLSCAVGGMLMIDFANPDTPALRLMDFDFSKPGYRLCVVDTGESHAGLVADYAAIPREMKQVAALFGARCLRDIPESSFYAAMPTLRGKLKNDRALLRASHFFAENRRVDEICEAMERDDIISFLRVLNDSGRSSCIFNQNTYCIASPDSQGVNLALAIGWRILCGRGALRVHGGGFAGTVQAFVPKDLLGAFRAEMKRVFGNCDVLKIRKQGCVKL